MRCYHLLLLLPTWTLECLASNNDHYQINMDEISKDFCNKLTLSAEHHGYEPSESAAGNGLIFFTQDVIRLPQYASKDSFNLLLDALVVFESDIDSIVQLIEALGVDSLHQTDSYGSSFLFYALTLF